MPKLNSQDKKWEMKILDWPLKAFPNLKEANKVKVWETIYKKKNPDKLEVGGKDGGPIRVIFRAAPDLPEQKAR